MTNTLSRGSRRYFITLIDDVFKYMYVYLLWTKDEAFEKFKFYKAKVENFLDLKIKLIFRSNRAGECCFLG